MKKVIVLIGNYGSGKTELAVNYAIGLRRSGYATAIVDIDLLKPYFRTRENRELLEEAGVTVIAPERRLAHGLPILPDDLTRVLYRQDCQVVMDVGGGESSIAIGQLNKKLMENPYQAWLVVNTRRPFTGTPAAIAAARRRIEEASRLSISGLVSNTNLGGETTARQVEEGLAITEEAAAMTGLPIRWVVVPAWLAGEVRVSYPVFVLTPRTRYPWMD